jgi:hypothetical protein
VGGPEKRVENRRAPAGGMAAQNRWPHDFPLVRKHTLAAPRVGHAGIDHAPRAAHAVWYHLAQKEPGYVPSRLHQDCRTAKIEFVKSRAEDGVGHATPFSYRIQLFVGIRPWLIFRFRVILHPPRFLRGRGRGRFWVRLDQNPGCGLRLGAGFHGRAGDQYNTLSKIAFRGQVYM